MTYTSDLNNYNIPEVVLERICEEGFDALPELIRIIMNTAMRIEREKHLGAGDVGTHEVSVSGCPL